MAKRKDPEQLHSRPPGLKRKTVGSPIYQRVCEILESARKGVTRTVNTTQVVANWLIGREIVEEEQSGRGNAEYGKKVISLLAARLREDFGEGYSATNLKLFRQFYLSYPRLLERNIGHTLRDQFKLPWPTASEASLADAEMGHTACDQSKAPGCFNPNVSWSLYRQLLKVEKPAARSFYEIEAIQNHWSARELERQINSLLYERLALSRDKKGLLRLARKGQEIQGPLDVFKDPLGLFLCTDENDAVVRYTLGGAQEKKIFASRNKLHLPTEAELRAELQRELTAIGHLQKGTL